MTACNAEDCTRPAHAKSYCTLHYRRLMKHGTPYPATRARSPEDAIAMYAKPEGGCLIWTGTKTEGGYGRINTKRRQVSAHRWVFEKEHGPIPEGMYIDHTCWNRACINIAHLRLATRAENGRNRKGPQSGRNLPRGVYRNRNGYIASVKSLGRSWNRYFATREEAASWVSEKRKCLFEDYAGGD